MEYMFLPLKRYAEFSGRSRRMEYWMWVVFQMLVMMAFWVLMLVTLGSAAMSTARGSPTGLMAAGGAALVIWGVMMLVWLAFIIPGLAVAVRRLHDTNRSGWWILAPIAGYVIMFIGISMAAGGSSIGGLLTAVGGIAALILAIMLLVFMFLEGTKGPNKYGPDPKGQVDTQVFA
ncbi:MAG TPA: DUF805 domain-containing protein [Allosphingosinicella sp.]|nr:DUF805 domain-containing protein [Allosphingosinicella sp.]